MRLRLLFALILASTLCRSGLAQDSTQADQPANDTITVIASGTGVDEKSALKQAFSNAIMQAVGTIVDAETVVKNDQIITDQILTASNAIISKYDPIGHPTVDQGLVTVKIKAVVERKQLTDRLTQANVISRPVEGQDLFAQVATELQNEKDATVIVRRVFEGFPTNVMKAEPIGEMQVLKKNDSTVTVGQIVRISVDREKYAQWTQTFLPVLTHIAVSSDERWWSPGTLGFAMKPQSSYLSDNEQNTGGEQNGGRIMLKPRSSDSSADDHRVTIPSIFRNQTLFLCKATTGELVIGTMWIGDWAKRQCMVIAERQGATKINFLQIPPEAMREAVEATLRIPSIQVVLKDNAGSDISGVELPLIYGQPGRDMMRATPFWVIGATMQPTFDWNAKNPGWDGAGEAYSNFVRARNSLMVFPYFGSYQVATPGFDYRLPLSISLEDLQRIKSVAVSITHRDNKLPKQWTMDPDRR